MRFCDFRLNTVGRN